MKLLVDIGNSTISRAWWTGALAPLPPVARGGGLLDGLSEVPTEVWVASVADARTTRDHLAPVRQRGLPVVEVRVTDHPDRLQTLYHPEQLGVDRWLGLLACHARGLYPAVVVDAGTATTVDVLDARGVHQGGFILPGLEMMRSSLLQGTAIRLQETASTCPEATLPVTTADAIHCGAIASQQAFIERLVETLGSGGRVVLSGGAAPAFAVRLQCRRETLGDVVLRGLAVLAGGG